MVLKRHYNFVEEDTEAEWVYGVGLETRNSSYSRPMGPEPLAYRFRMEQEVLVSDF